jgi:DNA/RNA-binding domain of Phe-tRNA-synthetase-like protein
VKFIIEDKVFEALPTVCFGVVVARGLDNSKQSTEILALLNEAMAGARAKYRGVNIKEHPDLLCYREAFKKIGFNPNKFLSSVEALTSRVVKGGQLPDVNSLVNLANAVSLKYTLPMGAHDLNSVTGDIAVRFSRGGEAFMPFGADEPEVMPVGEMVYADDRDIRTRRWIWRQSDRGKVTPVSANIFFPIDGFADANLEAVLQAREELSRHLEKYFKVETEQYLLDINNPIIDI